MIKKKKIGILTFHKALNYGAVLQAFALKRVCEKLGYEVHIVDYVNSNMQDENKIFPKNYFSRFLSLQNIRQNMMDLIYRILNYKSHQKRYRNFKKFQKRYLSFSTLCKNEQDISDLNYDVYISGSDQIWNYKITDGFDPVYFGSLGSNKSKSIVYAASSHDTPFEKKYEVLLKNILENKRYISVRENRLKKYLKKVTGNDYPVVLDPTLLAGKSVLEEIVSKNNYGKYILLYQIDRNPNTDITIETISKKYHCKVYSMSTPRIGNKKNRMGYVGPEDFISLVKNADLVITNSFHGIAISILFEKKFFVYSNNGVMNRIDDLLYLLGLENRKISYLDDINNQLSINYNEVNDRLKKSQEQSMKFLVESLNEEYRS